MNTIASDSIKHIITMEERARTVKQHETLEHVTIRRADLMKLATIAKVGIPPDRAVAGIDTDDPVVHDGRGGDHGYRPAPVGVRREAMRYDFLRKLVGTGTALYSGPHRVIVFPELQFPPEVPRGEVERQFDLDIDEAMQR